VRDRDDKARRTRDGFQRPGYGAPARGGGTSAWQAIAIVALIAATAGWTTVALLAFREPEPATAVSPSSPVAVADPIATDPGLVDPEIVPPAVESHDDPALEAILPTDVGGVPLLAQSVEGGAILSDGGWGSTITDFLTSVGKTSSDLHLAEASDPNGVLDISVDVYRVDGVDGDALLSTLIAAWRSDNPDLIVADAKLGGRDLQTVDFGEGVPITYVYATDGYVFDIWTDDRDLAAEALASLEASVQETPEPS
jgi:hypothetical protein